ncbi:MAG: YqgE/AlgH family protein [Candidatus Rokuibacteriota bacterium]
MLNVRLRLSRGPTLAGTVVGMILAWGLVGSEPAASTRGAGGAPAVRNLSGRLLVAAPEMRDPRFVESVIYMVNHDAAGAMGLVVNRPIGAISLAQLLERFGVVPEGIQGSILAHWGGPVETGKGYVLHTPDYSTEGTIIVKGKAALTGSRKVLEAIVSGSGPRRTLFAVGYAGWGPGQLEAELARGGWVTASADESLLFDDDYATKWQRAIARRLLDL